MEWQRAGLTRFGRTSLRQRERTELVDSTGGDQHSDLARNPGPFDHAASKVTGKSGNVSHEHKCLEVTGQVMFDSHIRRLLAASVDLVNAVTDGHAHGRPYRAPQGEAATDAIRTALPLSPDVALDAAETAYLIATAHQLRRVYEAVSAGDLDRAASTINTALRSTGARPQLDRTPGEPWQLHFHGADDSLGVGWSAGCVAAVALAAGSDLAGRLGVCQAERCDRVYVDMSRNAGRQFCSTACQNRAKAATFRARQASVDRG